MRMGGCVHVGEDGWMDVRVYLCVFVCVHACVCVIVCLCMVHLYSFVRTQAFTKRVMALD